MTTVWGVESLDWGVGLFERPACMAPCRKGGAVSSATMGVSETRTPMALPLLLQMWRAGIFTRRHIGGLIRASQAPECITSWYSGLAWPCAVLGGVLCNVR